MADVGLDTDTTYEEFMNYLPKIVFKMNYRRNVFDVELVVGGKHYVLEPDQPYVEGCYKLYRKKHKALIDKIIKDMVDASVKYSEGLKLAKP